MISDSSIPDLLADMNFVYVWNLNIYKGLKSVILVLIVPCPASFQSKGLSLDLISRRTRFLVQIWNFPPFHSDNYNLDSNDSGNPTWLVKHANPSKSRLVDFLAAQVFGGEPADSRHHTLHACIDQISFVALYVINSNFGLTAKNTCHVEGHFFWQRFSNHDQEY